jgi:Fe2+ or Zn2+ uptake regulation protein
MRIVLNEYRGESVYVSTVHRQVESRLSEGDVRFTKGRKAVVDALAAAVGPRSAAELADDLPTVPVSSLYRTLSVLEDAGVVIPHLSTKGIARYELAEWLTGHHHHLVCSSCGQVEDVDVPASVEEQVEELIERIAAGSAFEPSGHALEIEGTCARCTG